MPFYTSSPFVEEEEKQPPSSTFSTSLPVEETVESEPVKSYGFLSSAPLNSTPEPQQVREGLGYSYNVAEFRNNKDIQETWERFYKSAELQNYDNDVVEYLRDAEYSITSLVLRSQQMKNWSAQTRQDYTKLQRAFQKADGLGNARERLKFAGNLAVDILADPFNWASVAFAIPTLGGSLTVNAAAQALLRTGLNRGVKAQLTKEALKNTGSIALYGSAEGVTWGGAYEFFSQQADQEVGIQQSPTDWKKVGQVAALGGAFGAVIPGAIGGISNSLFLKKLYNFSNEDNIYYQAAKLAVDSEKVVDVNMSNPSTKIVFFKNQQASKGKQKKGLQLEIVPLTRRTYKEYVLTQAKTIDKELFKQVDSFSKFLKFNDVVEDNAFLVIRHGKDKTGKITKQVEPITETNGRFSAVSKEYLEEYLNEPARRQYWKKVGSFRDKDAITHTQLDNQSIEGLLYARQAGISEKEIAERAIKYGINIEDVDAAGYKQFKDMVQDNANLDAPDIKLTLLHKLISQTVGKATTKYVKLAENNGALVDYLESLVPGATNKLFKRRKTGVNEFTYGENKSNSDGFYLTHLEIALNRSGKTGVNAMIEREENDQLLALIMSGGKVKTYGGKKISSYAKTAYFGDGKNVMGIQKLLKHAFDEGDESGLFAYTGQVINYFPQKLQHSKIAADRLGFEDVIIEFGHADPINEVVPTKFFNSKGEIIEGFDFKAMPKDKEIWGRDFLAEAGENLDKARQLKASAIVDDMLERRWSPFIDNALTPGQVKGGHGFMKHRVFDKVPHVRMLPYIETDVAKVLQDYFVNFSQANVRTKMYGRNIPAMYKEGGIFQRIENEFLAKGGDRTQVRTIMTKLEEMHGLVTGLDHNTIQNNVVRTLSDWGKLSQQMAHLPLATVSSVTEPLLLLSRARAGDGFSVAYDIGHAIKKQTIRTFDRMAQNSKRIRGETTRGLKEFDDEEWLEIYKTGLALEQATMDRIEGLTGEALTSGLAKKLQNAFFKTNLLTQWTSAVQLAAFTTGKRLIKQNAESLYLHNAGIKKLGAKKVAYLSDQLEELGIPLDQADDWYKKYLSKDGVFNAAAANQDNFYKQRVLRGANRFTREIILNPSTSSANRPLWFSHPAGQLLMQFAGYPTVFNNTILKRFVNEAKEYPLQTTPKILATTMLMTAVAMLGNYIRTGGRNWEEQEPAELITHAVRRWGGFGALEYFEKTSTNLELGSGQLGSLLKTLGPLPADAVDALIYRKGIAEFATTNVPGFSALPKETRDYLKKIGRDADKALVEFLLTLGDEDTRANFARGGEATNLQEQQAEKAREIEYAKNRAELEDYISDNRLVSKEAQMSSLDGEGYRDPRFTIKTTGNELIDMYGMYPFPAEGSGRVLSTKELGMKGRNDLIQLEELGSYDPKTDKILYKDISDLIPEKTPEETQKHELLHRSVHRSGWLNNFHNSSYLKDNAKLVSGDRGRILSPLIHEALAHSYEAEHTDERLKYLIRFRASFFKLKDPNKIADEIFDNIEYLKKDFEKYLEEVTVKYLPNNSTSYTTTSRYPMKKARGGEVTKDRPVANAPTEPDERINKLTGLPYNATSPSVQDIEDRERRASGGGVSNIMQRLIEISGEAMGVGAAEQRANEKQAAAIVNQMVAAGTVPKYEYVPVDDYGFVLPANQGGRTGDAFEAVNHGLLSATYGDSMFLRGALQVKEIAQGFSGSLDSKRDSYNNKVGFTIRETSKTPEEINQQINNRIIRSYEKMGSGEALIPGEDFFLNPNEMEQ